MGMKTPQASWDNEVAANIAAVKVEGVRLEMIATLRAMRSSLASATGLEAEGLAESIADLEEMLAEVKS